MNILVCVKQVPDTTEIKIDPITNTLIRAGVPSIVNPFDAYALELAVRLKEQQGRGKITVLSMGPEQAKAALKECLSVGADSAYLVSDRVFGGSDTLATSYILSAAIKKLAEEQGGFDVIFCGKQAIDGDTGQVGPEIAEHLGISQVTYVKEIEALSDGLITVKRENDEGYERVESQLPVVLTVIKTQFEPRYATIKSKMAAGKAVIPTITSADIEVDSARIGLKGSPTKVKKTFTPQHKKSGVRIQEDTAADTAKKLCGMMLDAKLI